MQEKKKTKRKIGFDNNIKEKSLIEIKSLKIPENTVEKEKLMNNLKMAVTEIDMEIENLKLRKDYYLEIVSKISFDLEIKDQINPIIENNFDVDFSTDNINFNSYFNFNEKLSLVDFSVNNHIFPLSFYDNLFSKHKNNLFIEIFQSQFKETLIEEEKNIENNNMITNNYSKNEVGKEDLNSSFTLLKANSINSTRQSIIDHNNSNFEKRPEIEQDLWVDIEKQALNYEDFNQYDDYIPIDLNLSKENEVKSGIITESQHITQSYKLLAKRNKNINTIIESDIERDCKSFSQKKEFSEENSSCKLNFIDEFSSKPKRKYNKKNKDILSSESEEEIISKSKKDKKGKKGKKEIVEICPNYELFSEENLKDTMRNYGLKPISNKGMIKALREIFEFRKTRKLPDRLNEQLDQFLNFSNCVYSQQDNIPSLYSQSQTDANSIYLSQQYNNDKNSIKHFDEFKKLNIIKAIKENKEIWTKILRLEKIDLNEIKNIINKKDIIAEKNTLKEFLLEKGINLI